MNDRFEGVARDLGGRVQQKAGEYAGDAKSQIEGIYNQAAGQAQQQAARLSDVIKGQPITSALVAVGIGYLLGRFTA